MFGPRVADPILASGHLRPQQQAGHMIASDPIARACKSSCNRGAVHIWVPACAGTTATESETFNAVRPLPHFADAPCGLQGLLRRMGPAACPREGGIARTTAQNTEKTRTPPA